MPDAHAIVNHIPAALLVIFRIGGLMVYGPVFGSSVVPARVKIFMSFIVGAAVYPFLSSHIDAGAGLKLDVWTLAPLLAMEAVVGVIIGYVANLPLLAVQSGGLIMSQQMGLGFGQVINPAIDEEADIIGQFLLLMTMAGFLIVGGHEWMLLAVLNSFERLPAGQAAIGVDALGLVSGVLLSSLELALRVAAPLLALVFLETVAMGLVAKSVPQLNILSLGFPIRILAGIGVLALGLWAIHDVAMEGMNEAFSAMFQWIEGDGIAVNEETR